MSDLYVVLGMHKSGTTLVSEILHHSGVRMVVAPEAGGYDQGNFFERASTNQLNKDLLDCGNRSSLKLVKSLDVSRVTPALDAKAQALVAKLSASKEPLGFKDPRTCLTYQYWKEILPRHKIICVVRSFAQVHAHYTKRSWLKPFRGVRALRAWHVYNTRVLEAYQSQTPDERLIVDYGQFMNGSEDLDRMSQFVGMELVDRRVKKMQRSINSGGWRLKLDAAIFTMLYRQDLQDLTASIRSLIHQECASGPSTSNF